MNVYQVLSKSNLYPFYTRKSTTSGVRRKSAVRTGRKLVMSISQRWELNSIEKLISWKHRVTMQRMYRGTLTVNQSDLRSSCRSRKDRASSSRPAKRGSNPFGNYRSMSNGITRRQTMSTTQFFAGISRTARGATIFHCRTCNRCKLREERPLLCNLPAR